MTCYTYDMNEYLGNDRQNATQETTAIHVTVKRLTNKLEGVDHKLFTDSFFFSPDLHDDLHTKV